MDSIIELHADGAWHPAATLSVGDRTLRFEYLPDYVFGHPAPAPVAIGLPVDMTIHAGDLQARQTPLAFLWDLVPQGRGRQHLASLLGVSDQDPGLDAFLAQHGAFAPIGRLRLDTAVRFYETQAGGRPARGFTRADITARTDEFLDQLIMHAMLAAGTPGVQGVTPKFLLAVDDADRWYPDVALPDERARAHWMVKLPRGREAEDVAVLRHEAIYLRVAAACGLRSIADAEFDGGMLFLPRFDRRVDDGRVVRLHQETLASLTGTAGFGTTASMFDITARLAGVVTHPDVEIPEFLCRDVLNRAMRDPDNHLRNTSVQTLPDGTIRLTPLYDFAPMYLDRELVTRTCSWNMAGAGLVEDWNDILEHLDLADPVRHAAAVTLRRFGEAVLPTLEDKLRAAGADAGIIDACLPAIGHQARRLSEIRNDRPTTQS